MSKLFRAIHYSRFTLHAFVVFCLFFCSCASNYHGKIKSVHTAYSNGEYQSAFDKIQKIKPSDKDEFVYLMDKAMILHALANYDESNKTLKEAEDISDVYSVKSVSREVGSTMFNEEGIEYAGDKHERLIIPVIRMLNYIMLNDWNGAIVEARRLQYLSEKIYGKANLYDNPFATYLSGIVYEAHGKTNDALIDYKKLAKDKKPVPYYAKDIDVLSKRLGMSGVNVAKSSIAWQTTPNYRQNKGELIVIASVGMSPYYVSESITTGYFTVSIPSVRVVYPPVNSFDVYINEKKSGETNTFYNILNDIMIALKERQKRSMIRKMAKLSVQTGLYVGADKLVKSDETEKQIAGLAMALFGLSMSAADKADERSIRTLPYEIQLARFYLPKGEYDVKVVSKGQKSVEMSQKIKIEDKPSVWLINAPSVIGSQKKVTAGFVDEKTKELLEKERHLENEIRKKPANGELKLDLVKTKMLLGKYNVEHLIREAIVGKADISRAKLYYVISYTIRGEYSKAKSNAESNVHSGILNYLQNNGKRPDTKGLSLGKNYELENAFNYYLAGLAHEKDKNYELAVESFANAYKYGLTGKEIDRKLIENYKMTSDKFKKSKKGANIASEFANVFLQDK